LSGIRLSPIALSTNLGPPRKYRARWSSAVAETSAWQGRRKHPRGHPGSGPSVGNPARSRCATPLVVFAELYRAHFAYVWMSAQRFGVQPADIDDVVQETFLTVHRLLDSYEEQGTKQGWLTVPGRATSSTNALAEERADGRWRAARDTARVLGGCSGPQRGDRPDGPPARGDPRPLPRWRRSSTQHEHGCEPPPHSA
jgi:hypothetical protein